MLVEKLIKELKKLPKGTDVCLYDWRKNLNNDVGDGSSAGIHPEFDIELQKLEGDELNYYEERHERKFVPWIAITFDNDDYNDDGTKDE